MKPPWREEVPEVLSLVAAEAQAYLDSLDGRAVRSPGADEAAEKLGGPLPEDGVGGLEAVKNLIADGFPAAVHSAGPRFFHFVIGGVTPAALGADMLATVVDQNPGLWAGSPLGARLDQLSIEWLLDLFELPSEWGGTLTSGATMANFVALAAARRWWGQRHEVDVDEDGLSSLPQMPVLTGPYNHPSDVKVLGMMGIGRANVQTFAQDAEGRLDLEAMESALKGLKGAPAVLIGSAGEVNTGGFDPIEELADLAERYECWLHIDGAFGMFAQLSDRSKHLTRGVERADSVIADAHKWLNVAYDCGFVFLKDPSALRSVFGSTAAYLGRLDDPHPQLAFMGPESSQKARGLAVWTSLSAYGRSGYRKMVEHHLDLAQRVARNVDEASDLERLADVPLNIICFRFHPPGLDDESTLNDLNTRLGEVLLEDGRVFVGTTTYAGRVAFRPAIVNWRTSAEDVDMITDVVRELGGLLLSS